MLQPARCTKDLRTSGMGDREGEGRMQTGQVKVPPLTKGFSMHPLLETLGTSAPRFPIQVGFKKTSSVSSRQLPRLDVCRQWQRIHTYIYICETLQLPENWFLFCVRDGFLSCEWWGVRPTTIWASTTRPTLRRPWQASWLWISYDHGLNLLCDTPLYISASFTHKVSTSPCMDRGSRGHRDHQTGVTSCHFPMAQLAPHLVASVAGPVAGPMAAMAQMGPGRPARASRAPQAQWDGRVAALGLSLCPWVPKARATRGRRSARQRLTEQVKQVQRYKRGELSEFDTGVSTGYQSLDQNFRPVRGEVITLCGRPGSGKSEFILSVALNLAQKHGWKTGLCLFEHKADQLTLQLLEKRTQKNFRDLGSLSTEDEAWISEHFRPVADFSAEMDLEQILRRAGRYAEDGNLQNLIIDPYNYIAAPQGLGSEFSETELVSGYMTQLQRFAKKYQVCVWVVVHPTKGSQIAGAQPNLYDMQGSAHWYNKCDKGLYVVRPNRDPDVGSTCEVEIHVLKVRNGDSGRVGITKLEFQPEIRSYKELVPEMAWRHWEATLDLASPREICWKVPKGGKTGTWTRGRLRCQHLGLVGLACWGWSKLSLLEK